MPQGIGDTTWILGVSSIVCCKHVRASMYARHVLKSTCELHVGVKIGGYSPCVVLVNYRELQREGVIGDMGPPSAGTCGAVLCAPLHVIVQSARVGKRVSE